MKAKSATACNVIRAIDLEDCASHLLCHSEWNSALFKAIELIAEGGKNDTGALVTIGQLGSIGRYLSENAFSVGSSYQEDARKAAEGAA